MKKVVSTYIFLIMKSKLYISCAMIFIPIILMGQGIIISSSTFMTQSNGTIILLGNWTNDGTFTPATGTVKFAGTYQTISGAAPLQSFYNLTVATPGKVTIPAQIDITVNGTLSNSTGDSGLVFKSTAVGTGSLIHNTAGVGATIDRYMNANRWHIMSSSVTGQTIPGFVTKTSNTIPVNGSNYGMMYYSESGGGWVYYTNPASGNLMTGTGYLLRHTADGAVSAAGMLNAAGTSVNITKAGNGWNCIGNPFPCSMNANSTANLVNNFLTVNATQLDPSFAALYLWDEPAVKVSGVSYYKIICNSGFISTTGKPILSQAYMQPGQGFIVKSKAGGGTVSFTTAMRVHENTGSYFKSEKASWPGINLIISSASKSASTVITFNENMTRGLDITYDAGLFGGDPSFKLYSRLVEDNGVNFAIQCLPDNGFEQLRVPIGFDFKEGGTVTFTSDVVPLPAGVKAILVDSLLGKFTDFDEPSATYTTTVNPGITGPGRFYLNISATVSNPTTVNNIDNQSIDIYSSGEKIIVKGKITKNTQADLYDLSGRKIRIYMLYPSEINILPADGIPLGIYILKISRDGVNENKKVFLE